MLDLWETRYRCDDYIYGVNPNDFLRSQLLNLKPGRILFPAEGEGRNAVYAASLCWKVDAFDFSSEARKKALKLADRNKVSIDYKLASFMDISYKENSFDCIAIIYVHQPSDKRATYHQKLLSFLKPGGTLILEAFSKEQINNTSGGPKDIDLLYSKTELQNDFKTLSFYDIKEETLVLDEGLLHFGKASVIRLIGTK
jgi:ubiquinone/menaquinone biosynthesis C-methylase UbiE